MTRSTSFGPGEFYHLYNRGTEKRTIFSSPSDYQRFLALLYLCNTKEIVHVSNYQGSTLMELLQIERPDTLVDICAYCLMPNHFHLIVKEKEDGGISQLLQKISTGYTMYFNKKYERSGSLFQGKFKAEHASDDRYLKYLIAYVHLNPVKLFDPTWKDVGVRDKRKTEEFLRNYKYSSYVDFAGTNRPETKIVNKTALPDYFETETNFEKCMTEWLDFASDTAKSD